MTGSSELRLLCVHAHPDDESSKGAATMVKYVREGARVMVVTCTGGERGKILNPAMEGDEYAAAHLGEVRRREMERSAEILGVEHAWLGFADSGLPEGDPKPPLPEGCFALQPLEVTTEALVKVIRSFRPQVMTTYDESGGYPHPDHLMTHTVSMAALAAAPDGERFADAGEPWQISKIYYNGGFRRAGLLKMHRALLERGLESPFQEMLEWISKMPVQPRPPTTTFVDCHEYFPIRDQALIAHATQVDPDGRWF
ncbi:MAG: mycothiol conjugate amidase Mca, partial [Candidatus Dormibacteraceae bacterium]